MQRLLYRLFWVLLPPQVSWDSDNGSLPSLSLTLSTFDVAAIFWWTQIIRQQKILVFSSLSLLWFQIKTRAWSRHVRLSRPLVALPPQSLYCKTNKCADPPVYGFPDLWSSVSSKVWQEQTGQQVCQHHRYWYLDRQGTEGRACKGQPGSSYLSNQLNSSIIIYCTTTYNNASYEPCQSTFTIISVSYQPGQAKWRAVSQVYVCISLVSTAVQRENKMGPDGKNISHGRTEREIQICFMWWIYKYDRVGKYNFFDCQTDEFWKG